MAKRQTGATTTATPPARVPPSSRQYPAIVYKGPHDLKVDSPAAFRALGPGWTDKPSAEWNRAHRPHMH